VGRGRVVRVARPRRDFVRRVERVRFGFGLAVGAGAESAWVDGDGGVGWGAGLFEGGGASGPRATAGVSSSSPSSGGCAGWVRRDSGPVMGGSEGVLDRPGGVRSGREKPADGRLGTKPSVVGFPLAAAVGPSARWLAEPTVEPSVEPVADRAVEAAVGSVERAGGPGSASPDFGCVVDAPQSGCGVGRLRG
jgi:hypothetical protein